METMALAVRSIVGVLALAALVLWVIACEGILDVISAALRGAL